MIFKTFDSKIDKWTAKIGIFGKSFNEIGTAVNNTFKLVIDNIDNLDENVGFWESLKNNLFSNKDNDKDWIKNSLGEIISQENIDSYIAELDLDSAKNKLKDIFKWDDKIQNSDKNWQDYFETLKDGTEKYIPDLIKNTDDLSKLTGEDLVKANQQARASTLAHNEAIKAQTFSAKAGKVALSALATVGNMIAMWVISGAISLVVSALDDFVNSVENAQKAAKNFDSSFKTQQKNFNTNTKTLSKMQKEYDEVSKGVDSLGRNISNTNEQYDTYKDIISQVSDIMPELAVRYNEQGEKIGFVKGKLEDLNAEYDKYKKKQAQKIVAHGFDDDTTITDVFDNYNNHNKPESTPDLSIFGLTDVSRRGKIKELQDEINAKSPQIDFFGFKIDASKIIGGELDNDSVEEKIAEIQKYQDEIDASVAGIQDALMALSQANRKFWDLSDEEQNYVTTFLGNVTDEFIQENDLTNEVGSRKFINKFINAIHTNKNGMNDAMKELFSFDFDTKDMNPDEIKEKVDEMIQNIADIMGIKNVEQFKISLGFEFVNDDADEYDKTLNKFKGNDKQKGKDIQYWANSLNVTQEELEKLEKDGYDATTSIDTLTNALQKYRKESSTSTPSFTTKTFSEVWKGLKKETKEALLELAKSGELTAKTFKETEGADDFLKEIKMSATKAKTEVQNLLTVQEKLSAFSKGMGSLETAYNEFKDNKFVSAETLASLPDAYKGLKEYDLFSKIAGDPTNGKEKIKKAFDEIVTAYIKDQNTLVGVTEKNKNAVIANLKKDGVTNAREVVNSYIKSVNETKDLIIAAENELNAKSQKERQRDLNNFQQALKDKDTSFADACKVLGDNNAALMTSLGKNYADDYINWCKLCEEKVKAYNEMVNAINKAGDASTIGNPLVVDQANAFKQKYKMTPQQYIKKYSNVNSLVNSVNSMYKSGDADNVAAVVREARAIINSKKTSNREKNAAKKLAKYAKAHLNFNSSSYKPKSSSTKKDKNKAKKSTQVIDWIARKLDVLQSKIDLTKAKFENLFSIGSKKNNLNTQIAQTTKLLNTQQKAAIKYQKKANSIKLSSSLKSKVKNGKISGSLSSLIATYGESKANKITKYQDYADKAKQSTKAVQELKKNLLDLKKQKYQLYVDNADAKTSAINVQQENAITASSKNSYERNKLKWIKESYNYQIKIAQLEKDSIKIAQLKAEKEKAIADSYKQQFDNIKIEYDNKIGLNESNIENTQALISALEAQGTRIAASYYSSMMSVTKKDKSLLIEEKAKLEESLKNIKVGSDDWYEAKQSINSVTQEIYKCEQSIAEFQKTVNELELKPFELIASQIDSVSAHLQFLTDILSHKDLTSEDTVGVTREGMSTISLQLNMMKKNQEAIENTRNSWATFTKQVADGEVKLSEEEILAKYEEYSNQIREHIKNNEDLKDSIKSLVEEAFKIQLDVLNKLIEKRKEALRSEKDLYDYQRKVADQTKKITSIQKQMAALTGDDSEETRAKLQKLKVEYDEAAQDLKDTEYDKWISDQEDMLDDLSEDFEDFITNALKDTDSLIEAVEKAIAENLTMIDKTIREMGFGGSDTVGTKHNPDGSYTTSVTNYDGGKTSYTIGTDGKPIGVLVTDGNGKTSNPVTNKQNTQQQTTSNKEKIRKNNNSYLEKIIKIFAKSRPPKSNNEYSTANLTKYGAQMFAAQNGKGKLLSSKDAKTIDSYVKQLKNTDTGKALYNTSNADNILKALNAINKNYNKALLNAVKNNTVAGFAEGGVIAGNSYVGDKLFARVNSGETILTKQFTDMLPEALGMMDDFIKIKPYEAIQNLKRVPLQNNVNVGDVNIHLDGSNIFDEKSFMDSFTHSAQMQNAVKTAVANDFSKSYNNTFGKV